MKKFDDDIMSLVNATIAGDDEAFRKLNDMINESPIIVEQRDLLLEALSINKESNSNVRTLRALILLIAAPGQTWFQSQEGSLLLKQAVDAGNRVAIVHAAILMLSQADPNLKYEGLRLFREAAVHEEPFALSVGMKMFAAQNVTTFRELITALDAIRDTDRPSSTLA
ncbi:MAG: hypothetical protein M3R00_10600 [Pseudomonadota bacterium]|nr:hypothetical protein [Pseudomonadota bacterium]